MYPRDRNPDIPLLQENKREKRHPAPRSLLFIEQSSELLAASFVTGTLERETRLSK
jgi:hypothetical protein